MLGSDDKTNIAYDNRHTEKLFLAVKAKILRSILFILHAIEVRHKIRDNDL